MIIKFIKELLKQEPNTIIKVPWTVASYGEVMKKWHDYKRKNKKVIIEEEFKYVLKMMFGFHDEDNNHVMVFFSNNKTTCLCMSKYKGRYLNIEMPVSDTLMDSDSSFVATYCPKETNEPLLK